MICTQCEKDKDKSEFYRRTDTGGWHSECKVCFNRRIVERGQNNKRKLVEAFGGKCSRCGYNTDYRLLEFHHTDPDEKDFNLSRKIMYNFDRLMKEARKCILLCPNCHREKHLDLW